MKKQLIVPKQIVTVDEYNSILRNSVVEIIDDRIADIYPFNDQSVENFDGEVIREENLTLIPGFVQTHIHLCQTLFRGLADELELLDWLQYKIFPFENAHNPESLRMAAKFGINELITGGTTTILDMGTLRYQEIIFDELIYSGIRAFAGKCMMDLNDLFPAFRAKTSDDLKYTAELALAYHEREGGRIKYGFAPRFVLSCSEALLTETKKMMEDFPGSIFHTHASENKNEIAEVRKKFGKENLEYFDSIGVMDNTTVLAHCIHLNENEINLLKKNDSRVSHCPSSNLKLGSGIANIPEYINRSISVSLGADGAPCNNNLSIFNEMRLAALIQKPIHGASRMNAKTVFRLATIGGAEALNIADETGSIQIGKKADLVLLDLEGPNHTLSENDEDIYSDIVYASSRKDVIHVMIDGRWIVKDGMSLVYDDFEIYYKGQEQLKKLLSRL